MATITDWPDCDRCPLAAEKMKMSVSIAKMMADMDRLRQASIKNFLLAAQFQSISETYKKQIAQLEQKIKELNDGTAT